MKLSLDDKGNVVLWFCKVCGEQVARPSIEVHPDHGSCVFKKVIVIPKEKTNV